MTNKSGLTTIGTLMLIACLLLASAAAETRVLHLPSTRLAAAELRRYLRLGTAELPTLTAATRQSLASPAGPSIAVLTRAEALAMGLGSTVDTAAAYTLTVPLANLTCLVGSDAQNALYAVYTYLERLGFTFTSFGPTIPAAAALRRLPVGYSQSDTPAFTTRGLQPFHDFAEVHFFCHAHCWLFFRPCLTPPAAHPPPPRTRPGPRLVGRGRAQARD